MTIPIGAAWETRRLRELPLQIIDGDRSAKYPKRSEFRDSGVLFLNTTNIVNDRLDLSGAVFITEEKFAEIQKGRARRRDILMTTRGSIGKVALFDCEYDEALINAQILILRADDAQLDSRFLFYAVRSPLFKTHVANFASGAAQPQIPIADLREVEVPVPALPAQRRIADILSAYDDLIENNQRRIHILETMARALYREWFVEFRFPGHDKIPRVASPLGDIPQGWETKKLGDIIELKYGKALKKTNRRDGEYPVFGSSGIVGYHDKSLVEGPGIIVGRKGNVGSVFWSDEDFFVIDTAYYVTSSVPLRFLFYDLQTKNFINNDAAVPGLNRYQAYALEILAPPPDLIERFCKLADNFEHQASTLRRQIHNLRRTRDLLLPRLLSGQVTLTDIVA